MKKTIPVSEIFMSLEGEQSHQGIPTVYVRVSRCNKKCAKFNNPNNEISETGYAKIDFDPKQYNSLQDIPLIPMGCDTQYAVNPQFSHIWTQYDAQQLVDQILDTIPFHDWVHPETKQPVILSLTGGEPMLYMKFFVEELLKDPRMVDCKHVLFETNASIPLMPKLADALYQWAEWNQTKITWSNSPKLSNSGEPWNQCIKPDVLLSQSQHEFARNNPDLFLQYVKFVTDGSEHSLQEIKKAMTCYYDAGVSQHIEVGLMPEAATAEQQLQVMQHVANICINQGYRFVLRLQNILWGNAIGT